MLLSEGQMSDYKGAALMIDALPKSQGDPRRQEAMTPTGSANALISTRHLLPCIPSKANRRIPDPARPESSIGSVIRIENMFGKLKDWRRIHTRYDRCAHTFMSAICIAATVIFWL